MEPLLNEIAYVTTNVASGTSVTTTSRGLAGQCVPIETSCVATRRDVITDYADEDTVHRYCTVTKTVVTSLTSLRSIALYTNVPLRTTLIRRTSRLISYISYSTTFLREVTTVLVIIQLYLRKLSSLLLHFIILLKDSRDKMEKRETRYLGVGSSL